MEQNMSKKIRINRDRLIFSGKAVSCAQALNDVSPMQWSGKVLSGEKKAEIFQIGSLRNDYLRQF